MYVCLELFQMQFAYIGQVVITKIRNALLLHIPTLSITYEYLCSIAFYRFI